MNSSLLLHVGWGLIPDLRSIFVVFLLIVALSLVTYSDSAAQAIDDESPKWSIGLQAGVITGNLSEATATNILISRFNIEKNFFFTAALNAGYSIAEHESLHLSLSRGQFSVFTDHEFWPDVLFRNQFYAGTLSIQLSFQRFINSLPNTLDPYGTFGFGLMRNSHTVSPLHSQQTIQNDYSDNSANNLSFLLTAGLGIDLNLNPRVALFVHYGYNILSDDIIDKKIAGEVLNNDFIQTTNNWSAITSGIRIRFGKSKPIIRPVPGRDDFTDFTAINYDTLRVTEEIIEEVSDGIWRNDDIEAEPEVLENDSSQSGQSPPEPVVAEERPEEVEEETIIREIPISEMDSLDDDVIVDYPTISQPRFGLRGIAAEEIPGSFTIVVHSFSDFDLVDGVVEQLNEDGYRVFTQIVNVNGVAFKRIGIGQFENRQQARAAANELPEPYRNNNFLAQF